jgi:glyoxylase-like metal-dependent hydrolase (beta-lactamase superfamily II)
MSEAIPHDREPPPSGTLVELAPGIQRLIAPNASPYTFTGTCTYIVGDRSVAVIDPGPDDPGHRHALLAAIGGRSVGAVLITHTHRDHSPGARPLAALTGAPVLGAGPHRFAREPRPDEAAGIDASADQGFVPDRALVDGDVITGEGWRLSAIATPGHCANHLAFALDGGGIFSGDHVMAWSTSIVAPPDGSVSAYMASLDRLMALTPDVLWPGHGGPVREPQRYMRALAHHRRMREQSILDSLTRGADRIPDIVAQVYAGLDARLVGAAALNTLAHLEDLKARGLVASDGDLGLRDRYRRL